jgi:hypothetical protein
MAEVKAMKKMNGSEASVLETTKQPAGRRRRHVT